MSQHIKNRLDYKPLFWLPNVTDLQFFIYQKFTIVKSAISFKKNESSIIKEHNLENVLELNGSNLETINFQLKINKSKNINIEIDNFKKNAELIVIPITQNAETVKIFTEVKIFPIENQSLEGLYESNNMLCTQCEPEGFRKITWFPDRPDCLSLFKVKIEASAKYNTILSNGNLIEEGVSLNASQDRHFKIWMDPFPKPSYLFALVVGNLEFLESSYITLSKKNIKLRIYTEIGNKHLSGHAMDSLKKAMYWDEHVYGLEYDLDIFMIVAVSHFNMGAMENKGLNIFNSKYVLADHNTATDRDLKNIEAIVAHEYFHNWTGNRVTCRDWFQLTLKEGLTVFRDQEFSADMNERGVKRIEDVSLLKAIQFPEDSGSNKHPIRPDTYKEINNFYTPTVYEKGAEVIRMIYNYIGEKNYRRGIDTYFNYYDGQAVTCENFIDALSEGSKINLSIFNKWYSQAGTPEIEIIREEKASRLILKISQTIDGKPSNLPIPIKLGFLNNQGKLSNFKIDKSSYNSEHVFLLQKSKQKIEIFSKETKLTPSYLRSFSAPVYLKTDLQKDDYYNILKYDNDAYNKWDAVQNLYYEFLLNKKDILPLTNILQDLIVSDTVNDSLISFLLELPPRSSLENFLQKVDPIDVFHQRQSLMKEIGNKLLNVLEVKATKLSNDNILLDRNIGKRALLGKILNYLSLSNSAVGLDLANHYANSKNMTLSIAGIKSICLNDSVKGLSYLDSFYLKWEKNDLVLEKWFEMMASLNIDQEGLLFVKKLLQHEAFDYKNPNKLRSVLGTFQRENVILFHANDYSGYDFIADQITKIDKYNPQVAARLVLPMTQFKNFKKHRVDKIKSVLRNICNQNISNDLSEILEKAIH